MKKVLAICLLLAASLAATSAFAAPILPVVAPVAPVASTTAAIGAAGAPGTNDLSWSASVTPGTSANVYRAPGACASNGAFVKIASGLAAAGPYNDATPLVGAQCYFVTASLNGVESAHSNTIDLTSTVVPQPATGLVGKAN